MKDENDNLPLEHFRLKSLRRKKRLQRRAFEKKLIRLDRQESAISKAIWNLGYEELNPPIQKGWRRSFVLRDNVSRSSDAEFFQTMLDKINTVQYSWKRDFKIKRRHRGRKIYVVREQELARFGERSIKERKLTPEEMAYFEVMRVPAGKPGEGLWLYTFREPWRYKLKVEPNIIRWTRIKDFELERRMKEIQRYIDRNFLRPTMLKITRGRYQWRLRRYYEGDLPKYEYDPLKNRSFADILDEYMPDLRPPDVQNKPSSQRVYFFLVIVKISIGELIVILVILAILRICKT